MKGAVGVTLPVGTPTALTKQLLVVVRSTSWLLLSVTLGVLTHPPSKGTSNPAEQLPLLPNLAVPVHGPVVAPHVQALQSRVSAAPVDIDTLVKPVGHACAPAFAMQADAPPAGAQ